MSTRPSLVAGAAIIVGSLVAVPKFPDMSIQLEARALVLKAGKPVIWSSQDKITIR